MNINITTLFDRFFDYQPIDLQKIAASCKKCKLDTFIDICVALCAFLGFDPKYEQGIRFEFAKALTYHICVINGILEPKN